MLSYIVMQDRRLENLSFIWISILLLAIFNLSLIRVLYYSILCLGFSIFFELRFLNGFVLLAH